MVKQCEDFTFQFYKNFTWCFCCWVVRSLSRSGWACNKEEIILKFLLFDLVYVSLEFLDLQSTTDVDFENASSVVDVCIVRSLGGSTD